MKPFGLVLVMFTLFSFGCTEGLKQFPTTQVSGTVMCEGQAVPHALVLFEPIATGNAANSGKAAMGQVQNDGSFTLSTYGTNDGAVVGRHRVKVMPPNPRHHPDFTCDCAVNDVDVLMEVEVAEGQENTFDVVLTKMTARQKQQKNRLSEDDLDDLQSKED